MNRQGQLPKGWQICNLEEYIKLIDYRGRTPVKTTTGIRLITAKNVKLGYLQLEPQEFIHPASYNAWMTRGIPNYGDVIFTTEAPLANVAQLDTTEKVAFAQRIIVMQPQLNKIDQTFLKYLLLSDSVRRRILDNGTGATVQGIKSRLLKKIQLPLPPLPEQQHIVEILDEAFALITRAKANAEQNLKNAKELFESYLQSVFANKGEGWEEKTLGEVCSFEGGSQPSKDYFEYTYREGLIRLIQIRDYKTNKHIVYIPVDKAKRFCDENEIMIGRYGPPVFQILRGLRGAYNVALMKAIPNEKIISREFMFFFLQHRGIQEYIINLSERAVGQTGISREDLEVYPIYFPPIKKQSELANNINAISAKTKKLEAIYHQKLKDLEELQKSILQKAFNGALKTVKDIEV
jgi:type I restriction enzyme, S subunit